MKNKTNVFFLFLYLILFNTAVSSIENFNYEAQEIEVLDNGNVIKGNNNIKVVLDNNINITSDKLQYDKKNELVELNGNIKLFIKDKNIYIAADKLQYDSSINLLLLNGNVKLDNQDKNIELRSSELLFSRNENKIYSTKRTDFIFNEKYFGKSESFNYIMGKEEVWSEDRVLINDKLGNFFFIDDFKYNGQKKTIHGSNTKYIDKERNEYLISDTVINLKNNHILGKDLDIIFSKSTFGNSQNDPRLKARSFSLKENISYMNKGVFTTCKKSEKCPPWKIYAENITHDKEKETIKYKNAWLKIYDVPIAYFPAFSHPDPSVKRKSGFLTPSFMNSNSHGLSIDVPYYMVISKNKDLTFKPRFYGNSQSIIQNEYRQLNKNSTHMIDLSINNSNPLKSKNQSKSHFFSNSIFDLKLDTFESSRLELNLEKTTNDTYLKTYKIDSPLIDNNTLLNSHLTFNAEDEGLSLSVSVETWEDLSKNTHDRFEFIYPNYKISKMLDLKSNNLTFSSYGYQKNYQTNIYEGIVTNDVLYEINSGISNSGLKSKINALLKNVNTDSTKSPKYKDGINQSLLSSFLFTSELPLRKRNKKYDDSLTPKFSLMYSPNKTKNLTEEDRRIEVNNIYSFNRIGASDTVEGGASITLGTEYKKTNKKNYEDLISLNLATVIRKDKNEDLPLTSSLGDKHSDFFGNFGIKPSKNFDLNYNFALDNDLNKSNYDALEANISLNNFITSFEYINDKKNKDQQSYLTNNSSLKVGDNNSLGFNIRKNKKTNATEFYDLVYNYSNDCLEAAISFNKSYYTDADLKPEKQLFFSLTIIPFGKIDTPNFNK